MPRVVAFGINLCDRLPGFVVNGLRLAAHSICCGYTTIQFIEDGIIARTVRISCGDTVSGGVVFDRADETFLVDRFQGMAKGIAPGLGDVAVGIHTDAGDSGFTVVKLLEGVVDPAAPCHEVSGSGSGYRIVRVLDAGHHGSAVGISDGETDFIFGVDADGCAAGGGGVEGEVAAAFSSFDGRSMKNTPSKRSARVNSGGSCDTSLEVQTT